MRTVHEFELPIFVGASDYHDFRDFVHMLNELCPLKSGSYQLEELDVEDGWAGECDVHICNPDNTAWVAVVYTGHYDKHIVKKVEEFLGG